MSHDQTVKILEKFAGSQFDPVVVRMFVGLQIQKPEATIQSLQILAEAVESQAAPQCEEVMPA